MQNMKYLVMDVDGTLTDGGIYYDGQGNEFKKFSVKDGAGIVLARQADIKIIVLTGRECNATAKRMNELAVDLVIQNLSDKKDYLKCFMEQHKIPKEEIGYIGDDINDLEAMKLGGFVGCPADACHEVKELADYVSPVNGGYGAVRDIIEQILKKSGMWEKIISQQI